MSKKGSHSPSQAGYSDRESSDTFFRGHTNGLFTQGHFPIKINEGQFNYICYLRFWVIFSTLKQNILLVMTKGNNKWQSKGIILEPRE